jgi:predicted enzyme related to lactoylglutathione lyase
MKIKLTSVYVDEQAKARGAEFTMPPANVTASTIAMLNDTCGNLIQLTQLARY